MPKVSDTTPLPPPHRTIFYPVILSSKMMLPERRLRLGKEVLSWYDLIEDVPESWLMSIVDFPKRFPPSTQPLMFDNGAWTYRAMDVPPINWWKVLRTYEACPDGSLVVAPDHMLIEDVGKYGASVDLEYRRQWNKEQSEKFIDACPDRLKAMAVIHGMTIDERLENTRRLLKLGYKYLGIGGVAGLAAGAGAKGAIRNWVARIMQEIPRDVWVHVLGVTSHDYLDEWSSLGVASADGAAYFKRAHFGLFFGEDDNNPRGMPNWDIRDGQWEQIPLCDCLACEVLRSLHVDTRRVVGISSEGRAIHNLNIFMRVLKRWTRTLAIVPSVHEEEGYVEKAVSWATKRADRVVYAHRGGLDEVRKRGAPSSIEQLEEQLIHWRDERVISLCPVTSQLLPWVESPIMNLTPRQQLAWLGG